VSDVILSVLAHPDDAEFLCAGAMIRLAQEKGWRVHVASMTPGDCGSAELPADRIAEVQHLIQEMPSATLLPKPIKPARLRALVASVRR
jgi:LmbE family N-acetylglucosaminyl deacetylase